MSEAKPIFAVVNSSGRVVESWTKEKFAAQRAKVLEMRVVEYVPKPAKGRVAVRGGSIGLDEFAPKRKGKVKRGKSR